MSNDIPNKLLSLCDIKKNVTIESNQIFFSSNSIIEVILFLFFFFILPISLRILAFHNYGKQYEFIFFIAFVTYIIVISFIFDAIFKSYVIIDFNTKSIFSRFSFFDMNIDYENIQSEQIEVVCNNVIPQETNPGNKAGIYEGKKVLPNENTNLFHIYYVSFLLKNGKFINFIKVGVFEEDFHTSQNIAQALSDSWNIPLVTCKIDSSIKVNNFAYGSSKLTEEQIEHVSSFVKLFHVLILFIILVPFFLFLIKNNI